MTLTYLYCLVRSARRPAVAGAPRGMPGGDGIALVPCGDGLWLVIGHVPAREYSEAALAEGLTDLEWVGARALAHEGIVQRFLSARAVLPMQLFTLFTSDARAVEYVTAHRRSIERVLARVERQLEWGVRVTFEASTGIERAATPTPKGKAARRPPAESGSQSGSAYLARKRDVRAEAQQRLSRARTAGNRLYRSIKEEATAARRSDATEYAAPGSRLVMDAAFLVPVARAAAFRASVRRQAKDASLAGLAVSLTGPWPPYNFVGSPGRRS